MSEIGSRLQVARPTSQLPVDWYFDARVHAMERARLFDHGPRYAGHDLWTPEVGDYYTLPQEDGGRALVRSASGVELISNVCRHRQAVMLDGHGQTGKNIVCPLHRWTYDLRGELIGAPHFPESPCLNLQRFPLGNWNGLLFESIDGRNLANDLARDLGNSRFARYFDFTGYKLDRIELHPCRYNWKTFIEVYLEDYHVGPFHPGLGKFVNCGQLEWEFGARHSVQTVGLNNALQKPGSAVYAAWHDHCRRFFDNGKTLPEYGAIWLTYYPNIMLEWYPGVLCVSTLFPRGVGETLNMVEFYYPEEIALFERPFVDAHQAAYMETAREDDEIGERMDRGRRHLYQRGVSEVGPYQSPMEDGMQHFHEYLRRELI